MDQRVEIKVCIVGDKSSGKESFSSSLFLSSDPKIRVPPLSLLSEIFFEIDSDCLINASKKIRAKCLNHNNNILKQIDINKLRENSIEPFMFKPVERINWFESNASEKTLNKNILFTFYSIGSNYEDFIQEISLANIYILIIDQTQEFNPKSPLLLHIIEHATKSSKALLTLMNKSDLSPNPSFESNIKEFFSSVQTKEPIPLIYYSSLATNQCRKCIFSPNLPVDKKFLRTFYSKNISRADIKKYPTKYLKATGFIDFRNALFSILSKKFIQNSLVENFQQEISEIMNSHMSISSLIDSIIQTKNKIQKINKILKNSHALPSHDIELLKICLEQISLSDSFDLTHLDRLKEIFYLDDQIISKIDLTHDIIYARMANVITQELYTDLTESNTLPSKVTIIFDELYSTFKSRKTNLDKSDSIMSGLSSYIGTLYSVGLREYKDPELIFLIYFDPIESSDMINMLEHSKKFFNGKNFSMCLIQILFTKLIFMAKMFESNQLPLEKLILYNQQLRFLLEKFRTNNRNKKFRFKKFYQTISDISYRSCQKINKPQSLEFTELSANFQIILDKQSTLDSFVILDKYILNNFDGEYSSEENAESDSETDITDKIKGYCEESDSSSGSYTDSDSDSNSSSGEEIPPKITEAPVAIDSDADTDTDTDTDTNSNSDTE